MEKYHVRDLVAQDPYTILENYPRRFCIEFDDGTVMETSAKKTWASAFYWTIVRIFPAIHVTPQHHFEKILGNESLKSGSHRKLATNLYKSLVDVVEFVTAEEREIVQREILVATNNLYNGLRFQSGAYVQPIDILDCIELMYHPRIYAAVLEAPPTDPGVEKVYAVIRDVIDNDEAYRNNALVKAVRQGTVNFNQVCQSIGVRGFPKELGGRVFKVMARGNYLFGLVNLYEFAADSRGSAEHLKATESPLQDSEYFSRRLQLETCVLEKIAHTDCGTIRTIPWHVKPPGINENTGDFYAGDLKYLIGKKYYDADGELKTIKGDEKHLNNTNINMRSVLTCEHPDPHAVCQVCYGLMANNHSRWANLGVVSSTTVVSKISQKTLSTKHLVSSGKGSAIILSSLAATYFVRGPKNTDFVLRPTLVEHKPKIVVVRDEALGLIDIQNADDIEKFNPERITSLDKIRFKRYNHLDQEISGDEVKLAQDGRYASMSSDFLQYVKRHGWIVDEQNNFVIDLKDWDYEKVAFTLPDIQVSFSAQGNAIARVAESAFQKLSERVSENAPLRVLNQLFDMVNSAGLQTNIVAVEAIVYAFQQPAMGNYSLSRGADTPVLGIGADLILNRSMGTATAYQEWAGNFLNPLTYYGKNKPSTMMDVHLHPREVVNEFRRKHGLREYR